MHLLSGWLCTTSRPVFLMTRYDGGTLIVYIGMPHACVHTHTHACMHTCTHTHTHTCSYAEAVDTYESEEELRFLLPLKEYIAYCDSLRYNPHSYLEWRANTIIYKHITLICSLNVCANCICLMKVRIKVLQFLIKFATLKSWSSLQQQYVCCLCVG